MRPATGSHGAWNGTTAILSRWLALIPLLTGCSSSSPATDGPRGEAPSCPTAPRDPARWPFEASDPWNTPLGSGATFAVPSSPLFDRMKGAIINSKRWSHPVYIAQSSDPLRTFTRTDDSLCAEVRVPAGAAPDAEQDAHLHVIDETHNTVVETFLASRDGDNYRADSCVINDLRGPGVFSTWHGVRAYGGSALGGLIRKGELQAEIPHALAAAVDAKSLNQNTPNGKGFVWPASSVDNGYKTRYGSSGNLLMGTLLAIPPSVNLAAVKLTGVGVELGRALQDYGVYVVDIAGTNFAYYAEAAVDVPSELLDNLNTLTALLEVVTNNGPQSVGGSGTRRRCPAPPFIP